ncbi:MAG: hypothetical protein WAQ30_07070, partial [Bacillota bacterium]
MRNIDLIAEESAIRHFGGRRGRLTVSELLIMVVLIILALAVVLPLLLPWFFVFKTRLEFSYNPWSLPKQISWTNFREAWIAIQIGQGLLNTLKVCVGAVLCTVPSA